MIYRITLLSSSQVHIHCTLDLSRKRGQRGGGVISSSVCSDMDPEVILVSSGFGCGPSWITRYIPPVLLHAVQLLYMLEPTRRDLTARRRLLFSRYAVSKWSATNTEMRTVNIPCPGRRARTTIRDRITKTERKDI